MKKREFHIDIDKLVLPESPGGPMAEQKFKEAIAREVQARLANPELAREHASSHAGRIGQAVFEALQSGGAGFQPATGTSAPAPSAQRDAGPEPNAKPASTP